jgi:hypothetical protein
MTQMTTYNVVIAFNVGIQDRDSRSASSITEPRRRIEPFDTLIDGLRSDGLPEAAADINSALRVVKWPSTEAFVAGIMEELERIQRDAGQKMSAGTSRALRESFNRIKSL